MTELFAPISFRRGPAWKNRIMLAPLTNQQSHDDGTLSDTELHWLTMRAEGDFGLTMTCAAHVQESGKAFEGQLGIFSDAHLPGLTRLADALRKAGSVSAVQLQHGGSRTLSHPVGPSEDTERGTRALTLDEVERLRDDTIAAARRADRAGFDGVEVHGAHGYLFCAFLSPTLNRRSDCYGGPLANRARLLTEMIGGIRQACRPDFQVGLRLSPERFGLRIDEIRQLAQQYMTGGDIDYLDMSLWDIDKLPEDEAFRDRPLINWFTDLDRGDARLGVAGKVTDGHVARHALAEGADFVAIGKAGIAQHDLPRRLAADPGYRPPQPPHSPAALQREGLSPAFIEYMRKNFPAFVE